MTLFATLAVQKIHSADFWWQLRTGQWIVEHHAVPRHDALSFTVPGHDWIEIRWLFFALSYLGYSLGGPALLIVAQAAIVALAGWIVVQPSRKILPSVPALLVLLLGIVSASGRFIVRPEIVTFLMVAIFVTALDRFGRTGSRRILVGLPAAQVVWTSTHTLFVLGPVLAWLFVAASLLERALGFSRDEKSKRGPREPETSRRPAASHQALLAVLVTAACVLNPYGIKGITFPLLLWNEMHAGSLLGHGIEELRSPFAIRSWGIELWAWAGLLVVSAAPFFIRRRRLALARLAVWGAFAYLAFQSVRNIALFAFVAVWASLSNLREIADDQAAASRSGSKWLRHPSLTVALLVVALAGAWYVATDRYARSQQLEGSFGLGVAPWSYPGAAVELLLEAGLPPRIFNEMSDGSYLAWKAQGRFPVFVDGRNEVYGEAFLKEYLAAAGGKRDWRAFSAAWRIDTALVERDRAQPLAETLLGSPDWTLVHLDARDLVFVRSEAAGSALIQRFRIDPKQPWTPRGPEPDEAPAAWSRALGRVGRPWYSLGMARSFLVAGGIDNAAGYLERGLAAFPEDREMRLLLAQIDRSRGRDAEGRALTEGLHLEADEARRAEELLADLFRMQGRAGDAAEPLARAVALAPDDAALRGKLARAYLDRRDLPHAVDAYRAALSRSPTDASYWGELGHAYALQNQDAQAIDAYTSALRYAPRMIEVEYNLGIVLLRQQRSAEAAEHFRRALAIDPSYPPARERLDELSRR